ncbi:MAG: aldehyde dehydrogenase family protein, partial [Rhodothermales bacterium]|nr:aldehyde dehydrogenase family protein [Rhodothermales bacterium]
MIQSLNPATGQIMRSYAAYSVADVDDILGYVHATFLTWRSVPFAVRSDLMRKAAAVLRTRRSELARLMVMEMGKPIDQAQAEVEKCAWVCDFYADRADDFLAPEPVETDASESFVCYQPLGVILAVMPWNFPLWQVFRFAAPTLMAGNGAVLKHASNVPGCALAIESVFVAAGFPNDIFRTLLIGG